MLVPGSTVQTYTIEELTAVTSPATELPGSLREIETPTGPGGAFVSRKLTLEQEIDYLRSQGVGNVETAALVGVDSGAGTLTYEAPKDLSQAQVEGLGFAIVTASGTTHALLINVTSTYDSQTGALIITLPNGTAAADVLEVHLYRMVGGQEHILAADLNPFGSGSGTPAGTVYRDPLAIGDNLAVTAAVKDAGNTWSGGDLTAYVSQAQQNAGAPAFVTGQHASILVGAADVQNGDDFSGIDGNGGAYRYFYGRRNDGTSGWTRTIKG